MKVASTEVVPGLTKREFDLQVAGVVDTVLNRAATGKWGAKGDVRAVINAQSQFSKISGLKTAYGSVQRMPDQHINKKVEEAVLDHLQNRMDGAPSSIGEHLNYANPHPSAYESKQVPIWVQQLAVRARREGLEFGQGTATHVHGTNSENIRWKPAPFVVGLIK